MSIDIPPIISVDDHVIEPPDLWERWLPAKHREAGPRVVRAPWEMIPAGRQAFRMAAGDTGQESDFWIYGKFSGGIDKGMAVAGQPQSTMEAGPIDFADMRPGAWQRQARLADMDVGHVERSLCFPSFPRFCGQIFLQAVEWGEDPELALACVQAYND